MTSQLTSLIINGVNSPPRLFFARLLNGRDFCGATILSDRFVLTAGHCVRDMEDTKKRLKIEVGDFSEKDSPRVRYNVERIFMNPVYQELNVPLSDLALLKTQKAIENGNEMAIRVCNPEESMITENIDSEIIGACGMGSFITEVDRLALPKKLKQMIFKRTVLIESSKTVGIIKPCPEELICVKAVIEQGSICMMDDGGPLYKFLCRSMVPDCLMGVASFSLARSDTPMLGCNNGSFFTNVPLFYDWIDYVMNPYIKLMWILEHSILSHHRRLWRQNTIKFIFTQN